MAREKRLRLILGDQLNPQHSWFKKKRTDTAYVMMEIRQETDHVKHHIQKVVGFFAAIRHFAEALRKRGHTVHYFRLDDPSNSHDLAHNIQALVKREKFTRFEYLLPDEYRLDRQLKEIAERMPVPTNAVDTQHFLTQREDLTAFFNNKKRYLMENFYRYMRKRCDILMNDGKPEGGKWNYDQSNRNRYDGAVPIPSTRTFRNDVSHIEKMIRAAGVDTFGTINPRRFPWPVSRQQALIQLRAFMEKRLAHFGTYQDAMTAKSDTLFHSRLSFALNTKMLNPMEVLNAAIKRARKASDPQVGIAQLEGFVRQILGWREYMRGVYWARMPEYEGLNYFGHNAPLPEFYWTADTRMKCLRTAVRQSLEQAYAHHAQRLMVTGNFALLAGIDPNQVDAWYLGIYMDAVQWVEIVNTRGMSQYADGGIVATKPYISSSKYIRRMSDYCDGCFYNWKESVGDVACPFNSMYWEFLARHRAKLGENFHVAMMYRTLDSMAAEKREALLEQGKRYRAMLSEL